MALRFLHISQRDDLKVLIIAGDMHASGWEMKKKSGKDLLINFKFETRFEIDDYFCEKSFSDDEICQNVYCYFVISVFVISVWATLYSEVQMLGSFIVLISGNFCLFFSRKGV